MTSISDNRGHTHQRNHTPIMPKHSIPNFDFDFQGGSRRLHFNAFDNQAELLMFFPHLMYDNHHTDPDFIDEYNKHILGMIMAWKITTLKLLRSLENHYSREPENDCAKWKMENHPQDSYACTKVTSLMKSVSKNRRHPIGKLSFDYMRRILPEIDNEDDALFVYKLATCTKFEIHSEQFQVTYDDGETVSRWKLVTVCYFKKYYADDSTLRTEEYDFGLRLW